MIHVIGWIALSIVIVLLLIDAIPIAGDWLGRIKIGRFEDKRRWKEAIVNVGLAWLNRTPKMKVTDNTRLIAIDMWKGHYSSSTIQHWQEAALLLGLSSGGPGDERTAKEIRNYLNRTFNSEGQWRQAPAHVDSAIVAYAVMKLQGTNPDTYKPALDATWHLIQDHIGADGTVAYRKFMQQYRYVDTIGFICPFLVAYGLRYGKPECIELAVQQIQAYEEHGMLQEHFIPCHAYRTEDKAPLGLYGWGRGLAWYALGLMDAWKELPAGHKYKSLLETSVARFASAAMRYQQPGGNWNWTVTRAEARADSSATAVLGWYLLEASRVEGIAGECRRHAERAVHYLMKVTRRSGAVDFSQGDTKDIGVYAMLFGIMPFTQGFCMRLMNSNVDLGGDLVG
ncbi:glycoside hydrolase family 88 protein [Paenibacillus chartarius]|uniref:Glycoside hydrolase family 88 protein n=1 Tax=Paenibacillus chartarius TaxID=747481 RepID=A0ABV6DV68_9BACL